MEATRNLCAQIPMTVSGRSGKLWGSPSASMSAKFSKNILKEEKELWQQPKPLRSRFPRSWI